MSSLRIHSVVHRVYQGFPVLHVEVVPKSLPPSVRIYLYTETSEVSSLIVNSVVISWESYKQLPKVTYRTEDQ